MKQTKPYFILSSLLFLSLLFIASTTSASHIVGVDLSYAHVSGLTYRITLVAYGDCGPASASAFASLPTSSPQICIFNGSTMVGSVNLAIQPPSAGVEITPVCPSVLTQCSSIGSTVPGIKKFVYAANYTLPSTSAVWRFLFSGNMGGAGLAGRAAAITNILSGTTIELVDTLNNTAFNNTSPALTVVPTPFFCLNNANTYNPGAADPDGDRLSFSLVSGKSGTGSCSFGSTVSYIGTAWTGQPITAQTPLQVPGSSSFSFDTLTGQISFYPNLLQRALVVYNVREFRSGVLVGTCQREMTFLVLTCTGTPPTGSFSSSTSGTVVDSTHFEICAGTGPFSIFINPTQADTSNNIFVSATGLPAGATFTTMNDGTNHPNCTFSWTTTGVAPGSYIFYVTYRDDNCPIAGVLTRAYTVTIWPSPTIAITGRSTFCVGGSTTLSASGGISYSWLPPTGLSCTACPSPVASPIVTTVYTVTGRDVHGCPANDTAAVTVKPLPLINAGLDVAICTGSSTTLSATGGISYSWSPGTGLSCTTCASTTASPSVTTSYTVTGTGANGCVNTDVVRVTVHPLPSIFAGGSRTICVGGSVALVASGGVAYIWGPSTGLSCTTCSAPVAAPVATTVYTLTGTDANGCVNVDTARVTVVAALTVSATDIAICYGTTGTLSATGAATYSWSPSSGLSCTNCANPTANPTATTTYTLIGTSSACADTTTVTVTVHPLPVIDAGSTTAICVGNTTTLIASGGVSYLWGPSAGLSCTTCTSPIASPATTTIYTLTGTDANGCSNTDTLTITVNPLPIVRTGVPITLCPGDSAVLSPTGATSYIWSPGSGLSCSACTNPIANPLTTTVYTVTGTDANGCIGRDTIRVARVPAFSVSVSSIAICAGVPGGLSATGAATYSWLPGSGLSCTNCSSPMASPAGTTTYTVIGAVGSCTVSAVVTVTVHPTPVIVASGDPAKCIGDTALLSVTGGISYNWLPSSGLSCTTCSNVAATPAATTSYSVTGYNIFGCRSTAVHTLIIHPLPILSVFPSPAVICEGSSVGLTASGGAFYYWSPPTGLSATTGSGVVANPISTSNYKIIGTDSYGCRDSITADVIVNPIPPAPVVVTPVIYCQYAPALPLSASGSGLLWYTSAAGGVGTGTTPTPSTATLGETTWFVSQTVNGCESDRSAIRVQVIDNAHAGFEYTLKYGCIYDTLILSNTSRNAISYLWRFDDGTTDTNANTVKLIKATQQTFFYDVLLIAYSDGCYSDSIEKNITVLPTPRMLELRDVTSDQTIQLGTTVQLNADGAATYLWLPANSTLSNNKIHNPIAQPIEATKYTVYGWDENGCMDSADVHIAIIDTDEIVIPNAFTPNGDGMNDVFRVIKLRYGKVQLFSIYNRWGEMVYRTNDIDKGWDGTYKGEPQDLGVFQYLIIVERINKTTKVYKGDVTLVK